MTHSQVFRWLVCLHSREVCSAVAQPTCNVQCRGHFNRKRLYNYIVIIMIMINNYAIYNVDVSMAIIQSLLKLQMHYDYTLYKCEPNCTFRSAWFSCSPESLHSSDSVVPLRFFCFFWGLSLLFQSRPRSCKIFC